MYDGNVDTTKSRDSKRRIPIPPALLERLKTLGNTGEWIFHARGGAPLNPGNALKRYTFARSRKNSTSTWAGGTTSDIRSQLRCCAPGTV